MHKRWTLYTSANYTGKKSTYPVWVLHWLTYFLNQNPTPPRPAPPPAQPSSTTPDIHLNLDGRGTQEPKPTPAASTEVEETIYLNFPRR